MIKVSFILLLLLNILFAKQDFVYSYINQNGDQISEHKKQKIIDGYDTLDNIKTMIREGGIQQAYDSIRKFYKENKLQLLKSDIILLYGEVLLKKGAKRHAREGVALLEKAINNSDIQEDALAHAYMVLVDLKLEINKIKEARYYAHEIIENFDNPIIKAYGQIKLAKVYSKQRNYKKAINLLYKILTQTKDITIATIVADELFDIYILDKQDTKAKELSNKVLSKNLDYYANDSYIALKKVEKLLKADMPELAVTILKELLSRATIQTAIEDFKFRLADTYMLLNNRKDNIFMLKAKELYKDILQNKKGPYSNKSKMALDEILMREGKIEPRVVAKKYQKYASMEQKALLQELINNEKQGKYELILRSKKVYKKISNTIAKRFGYKNINEVFEDIHSKMIKNFLNKQMCTQLNNALKLASPETVKYLIKDNDTKYKFFECMIEAPNSRGYTLSNEAFTASRDAKIYLYLERMAMAQDNIEDALAYSQKVKMMNDDKILKEEFLYKFILFGKKNNSTSMDEFFTYALQNPDYIEYNINNPIIIDFYYQFYLYLIDNKHKAKQIIQKLYDTQVNMKAYVYSPFTQIELSSFKKEDGLYEEAIKLLNDALKLSRRMTTNDKAHIFYELTQLYRKVNLKEKAKLNLKKCNELKDDTSFWKKMCRKL